MIHKFQVISKLNLNIVFKYKTMNDWPIESLTADHIVWKKFTMKSIESSTKVGADHYHSMQSVEIDRTVKGEKR